MLLLAAMLALQAPVPARPTFLFTGATLQRVCSKDDDLNVGLCIGYASAAADEAVFRDTTASPRRLCVPSNLINARLREVLTASLAKETNGLALPATLYIQRALASAFACEPTGASKGRS